MQRSLWRRANAHESARDNEGTLEIAPAVAGQAEDVQPEPPEESGPGGSPPVPAPEWPDGELICGQCGHGSGKEIQRLKAEAESWKHQLAHLPKNLIANPASSVN